MTTGGILELKRPSERAFIYGWHDSHPDGWPLLVVRRIISIIGSPLPSVVGFLLSVLRDWDFTIHSRYDSSIEAWRMSLMHFSQVSPTDIPGNLAKDWDFWYIIDLNNGGIIVKSLEPVVYHHLSRDGTILDDFRGFRRGIVFRGSLKDYIIRFTQA